jgi:hypothetical protein
MSVQASNRPIATDIDVAKSIGTANLVSLFDGDILAHQTLPEVQAVQVRLELRVCARNGGYGIGNAEYSTLVEAGELFGGRIRGINTNDEWLYFVSG